jgi:hypothetical protein
MIFRCHFAHPHITIRPARGQPADSRSRHKVSKPQIVTLTNVGSTTLSITSIKVTGADHGDFSASNTCGKSLGAGAACSINVRFIPTQTGTRAADVSITDNGGGSPQEIKLSGTGT